MHKKGDGNLTQLLFGLLVTILILGVAAAILGNVSSGIKKFVKLNINCFNQDTDEDGTRDVAEDWIGMGDGCPCDAKDLGLIDSVMPLSGSKHKCPTLAKDCETMRYDKCLTGEKGTGFCTVPGRPPSDACKSEDQFGKECGILNADRTLDPAFAGFKGVCNRAEQCVPPCEFCPCFGNQAPAICQDPHITQQHRCLKDDVKSQRVSCSAQQGLCQSGYACCNAQDLKEVQREKESKISQNYYKACLYGLTTEEYDLWQTEMKKPGGYDPNNEVLQEILIKIKKNAGEKNSADNIWSCLHYTVDECKKKSQREGWGACQDLLFASKDLLKSDKNLRLSIKPFVTPSSKKIQFKLSNKNDPFFETNPKYTFEIESVGLCTGVIEGAVFIWDESFPKQLMCLNAKEQKFFYGSILGEDDALRGDMSALYIIPQPFEVKYINTFYVHDSPTLCFIYFRDPTFGGKILCNE